MTKSGPSSPLARAALTGAAAGIAGTSVMSLFQRFVEMPLSERRASDAPLKLFERVLPVPRPRGTRRRRLNWAAHFVVGTSWGAGHGAIAHLTGTRGQAAAATVFATLYGGDVAANTALGLYEPAKWSGRDWLIDIGNKAVLAESTALVYDAIRSDR